MLLLLLLRSSVWNSPKNTDTHHSLHPPFPAFAITQRKNKSDRSRESALWRSKRVRNVLPSSSAVDPLTGLASGDTVAQLSNVSVMQKDVPHLCTRAFFWALRSQLEGECTTCPASFASRETTVLLNSNLRCGDVEKRSRVFVCSLGLTRDRPMFCAKRT